MVSCQEKIASKFYFFMDAQWPTKYSDFTLNLFNIAHILAFPFSLLFAFSIIFRYVLNEFLTVDRSCITKYFWKTLIEAGSSHLYSSFGTFCVQIGQLFEAQWVFEKCLKTVKSLFSKENVVDFQFFRKFKVSLCLE